MQQIAAAYRVGLLLWKGASDLANVAKGSNSVVPVMSAPRPLSPESGRPSAILLCRIRATTGCEQMQQREAKITRSLRRRGRAAWAECQCRLAVCRLMTNSNLGYGQGGDGSGSRRRRQRAVSRATRQLAARSPSGRSRSYAGTAAARAGPTGAVLDRPRALWRSTAGLARSGRRARHSLPRSGRR
jgi:hypothetical protein